MSTSMQIPPQEVLILDTQGWAPGEGMLDLDGHGVPALFRGIQGSWRGTYFKLGKDASRLGNVEGVFTISFTGNLYRQTNRYRDHDGSTVELSFTAIFQRGILTMESESRQSFAAVPGRPDRT